MAFNPDLITSLLRTFVLGTFMYGLLVLIHECGHALVVLAFTAHSPSIYVGARRETSRWMKVRAGRLSISINTNPLRWLRGGSCHPGGTMPWHTMVLFTLGGLVAQSLAAAVVVTVGLTLTPHGTLYEAAELFVLAAAVSLVLNSIPRTLRGGGADPLVRSTDGFKLIWLWRMRHAYADYLNAVELCTSRRFAEAATLLDPITSQSGVNPDICRLAVLANMEIGSYARADAVRQAFEERHRFTVEDHFNAGIIAVRMGRYEEAIERFGVACRSKELNEYARINRADTLTYLKRYDEALREYDSIIEEHPRLAIAHAYRALACLRSGAPEEGRRDIDRALSLDPSDSAAIYCLGLYNESCGSYAAALEHYRDARARGGNHFPFQEDIQRVERLVGAMPSGGDAGASVPGMQGA
ncbi:MAG TPA: tetratricopeptide repeat protein [Candidatus Kapabacteria bacterium]|nr:tetratricopeptide repeat protein [Candidatus Kapabacteria bacterium]